MNNEAQDQNADPLEAESASSAESAASPEEAPNGAPAHRRGRHSPSVHELLPWTTVCRALGIALTSQSLPQPAYCPLCHKDTLDLYHHGNLGWYYCIHCKLSGDLLELACRHWNLAPLAALVDLRARGFCISDRLLEWATVDHYIRTSLIPRQGINYFWSKARGRIRENGAEVKALRQRLHLNDRVTGVRWENGPGRLLGAATRRMVEERLIDPGIANAEHLGRGGDYRYFRGRSWGEVLTVPFYSRPGLIQGFMFLGRQGQRPHDQVYVPMTAMDRWWGDGGAGLAGITALDMTINDGYVIACDDWLVMLRLQLRRARKTPLALPLVAWYDDGKYRTGRDSWASVGARKPIFWAAHLDERVIRQAVETNGDISIGGPVDPSPGSVDAYLHKHTASALEQAVVKHAKAWDTVLRRMITSSPRRRVNELLQRLDTSGADIDWILDRLGDMRPDRLSGRQLVAGPSGGGPAHHAVK